MKRFAALLDRLSYEPARSAKVRLLVEYFEATADPDRGYGLAAMAGRLDFPNAKPAVIRDLIALRADPVLFALAYDYVGDLAETVALMWRGGAGPDTPALAEIVETLQTGAKASLPRRLAEWLDRLEEIERWALLKLVTGALRIGLSARLAKMALAEMAARRGASIDAEQIEEVWHGLSPPYGELFAWIEGRGLQPVRNDPAPFRSTMLANAIEAEEFARLDPADFVAEWKWDGIRAQLAAGRSARGTSLRLYSRSGEDISSGFPDLFDSLETGLHDFCLDGELLIVRAGEVMPFNALQQRLNRRQVPGRLLRLYPAHLRAYDLLFDNGEDLRPLPLEARRARLEALVGRLAVTTIDLSPLLPFSTWEEAGRARENAAAHGRMTAVEGLMLKRRQSPYLAGRPKGHWYKWKHDPLTIDAILMYAQRGHGKRSSFYSDFTFGVWKGTEVVPVGKAYFGFTDVELVELDRFVRHHTINRYGPVREVVHEPTQGLVLEIAFEGIQPSPRHRSGLAMRFPRIARIRWDKPVGEADRIESLQRLLGHSQVPVGGSR
jgi:DNA ligase-1